MHASALFRLHVDLLSARVFLWFASLGRAVEPTPEVHLYLADLHFRLAAAYEAAGRLTSARRHRDLANQHASMAPPPPPRPPAAMAMAVPVPPWFTDARGSVWPPDDPPESA